MLAKDLMVSPSSQYSSITNEVLVVEVDDHFNNARPQSLARRGAVPYVLRMGARMKLTIASAVLFALSSTAANAQEAAGKVQQAIEESANGKCSSVLSTMVKYACEQQATQMAATFKALGQLKSVAYKGTESTPNGKAEVYLATHQNGKMMWMVVVAPDGKLSTFWSPGPTQ